MNPPASSPPMLTPAVPSSDTDDGRKACRHMMRRWLMPLERAIVMNSSCSVAIRSLRNTR